MWHSSCLFIFHVWRSLYCERIDTKHWFFCMYGNMHTKSGISQPRVNILVLCGWILTAIVTAHSAPPEAPSLKEKQSARIKSWNEKAMMFFPLSARVFPLKSLEKEKELNDIISDRSPCPFQRYIFARLHNFWMTAMGSGSINSMCLPGSQRGEAASIWQECLCR